MTPEQLGPGDSLRGYRILRELAQGGFSRIFLVELEGRRYALKLATTPASPEDLDHVDGWMRREAVSLEHLAHENLLPVYELGRWPDPRTGYSFFVTEPVDGTTLHVWRRHTRASLHAWVGVSCKVLRALEHMHARGVIHRDLKADNVLVRERDSEPFVIDLGSVHLPCARPLTEGTAPATLHCQPPEAVAFLYSEALLDPEAKLEAHPTADLYCIGAMLYEALTDRPPFLPTQPLPELLPAILHAPPPGPLQLNPQAPASLAALCLRLLAKEPQARPQSARAVREELERLLAEEGHTGPWQAPAFLRSSERPVTPRARRARPRWWVPAGVALGLGVLALGWWLFEGASHVQPSLSSDSSASSPFRETSRACALLQALVGLTAAQLVGCATIPPVRPDPVGFLSRCSTEARITPRTLAFVPGEFGPDDYWYPAFITSGTPASAQSVDSGGPVNIRSGPFQAVMFALVRGEEEGHEFTVSGQAYVTPKRVYFEITRIQLADGSWLPLCGVGTDGPQREYGIATYKAKPVAPTPLDPALVDTHPDSAVLNDPRIDVFVQPADARVTPSFLRMPSPERR